MEKAEEYLHGKGKTQNTLKNDRTEETKGKKVSKRKKPEKKQNVEKKRPRRKTEDDVAFREKLKKEILEEKGCVVMVSCSEQIKILSQILKEEIEEFDKLSKDEAKKKAQEDLKEIGFLDDQGNVTEPYIALRQECTARKCQW